MILSETLDLHCMSQREPLKMLTPKQLRFIDEYFTDLNATQAAIRAGYSKKTARCIGCENLTKPNIAAAIKSRQAQLQTETEVSRDRLIKELTFGALLDPGKMFDNHGNPLEIAEMPPHLRRAIASFEFYEDFEGGGESRRAVGYTKKFKFIDKLSAIKQLAEMLGYTEPAPSSDPKIQSVEIVFVNKGEKTVGASLTVINPQPQVTFVSSRREGQRKE